MARRTATKALGVPDVETRILFAPRSYQLPVMHAMLGGTRRFVSVWHRRAGKDRTWVAVTLAAMMRRQKPGVYFHVFPSLNQGRRDLWDNIGSDGRRFTDIFPREFVVGSPNETEMQVKLRVPGGEAIWQIMGADDEKAVARLRGPNPFGLVFSEYAHMLPSAWDTLSPVLSENGGWAAFIYTPNGKNHGYDRYLLARDDPDWFCSRLTVDQTHRDGEGDRERTDDPERAYGMRVVPQAEIDRERRDGKSEEFIQQEYYCSFDSAMQGAYYGEALARIEADGRLTRVAWDPKLPVETWWDIGISDSTAICFTQRVRHELHVIDYLESSGHGIEWYVKQLRQKEYVYSQHLLPHDGDARELGTGKSIREMLQGWEIKPLRIVPKLSVEDGISAARAELGTAWFDKERTAKLWNALLHYRREWDDKRMDWKSEPYHDWASHGADAFRTGAVGSRERSGVRPQRYATSATVDIYGDQRGQRYARSETAAW